MSAAPATIKFDAHEGLCGAGVLFLLPALLAQGLLKTKELYTMPPTHYYGLETVMLTLAFMALARIKNPEQLKQCRPGEIGKMIGLDRIPEVSCLREKIGILTDQGNAQKLNNLLIDHWYRDSPEEAPFLYMDGHVRIYYGHGANLPLKFISRQKLCLSATTEFWVNDAQGMPVMMVTGELTEKLQQAIEGLIIPQLQQTVLLPAPLANGQGEKTGQQGDKIEQQEDNTPVCTLVFDREAYEPAFFGRLWKKYRIAVLTYRKNVRDTWAPNCFKDSTVQVLDNTIPMQLGEQGTTLGGVVFREIRRLTESGHQTAIITTNPIIGTAVAAGKMFGRWGQENFFRYMIMDYDFDKMIEFGTEAIDGHKEVVNPLYRKAAHAIKKEKEKMVRLKAKLYPLAEQSIENVLEDTPALIAKQAALVEQIEKQQEELQRLEGLRGKIQPRVTLKEMPDQLRYNKLKHESKMLMNIIKMICYRAETSVANELGQYIKDARQEKRMLAKQIIAANADMIPDHENKALTIVLHSLSTPRYNKAAEKLAQLLTQTETVFPATDWKLIFKTSGMSNCEG
jgi:hypothetical protein